MNTEKAKIVLRMLEIVFLSPACIFVFCFFIYNPNCEEVGGAWLVI